MYWREEGTKGRVVKDERTRKDFRGEVILRILARLVVWCGVVDVFAIAVAVVIGGIGF